MPLYICKTWDGEMTPHEGQAIKWVAARELKNYPMPPADLPLIPWLRDFLA
jgi:8-oxo-dGTP diphosphatase